MKKVKFEFLIILGLLLTMISVVTIYLFHAPFQQMQREDPAKMKIFMEDMMKELSVLKSKNQSLPEQKELKTVLSRYLYHSDYDAYMWNEKQEGIYYANYQEHYPISFRNQFTNAILKQPIPHDDSIQFIVYEKDGESQYGYFAYIPEWKVYISLTGTKAYFENPEITIWKSIIIEICSLLFAIMVLKETWEKIYGKPLLKIIKQLTKMHPHIPKDNQGEHVAIDQDCEKEIEKDFTSNKSAS